MINIYQEDVLLIYRNVLCDGQVIKQLLLCVWRNAGARCDQAVSDNKKLLLYAIELIHPD